MATLGIYGANSWLNTMDHMQGGRVKCCLQHLNASWENPNSASQFPSFYSKKKKNGNLKGENIGRGHSPAAEVKLREQNMQKKNEKKTIVESSGKTHALP